MVIEYPSNKYYNKTIDFIRKLIYFTAFINIFFMTIRLVIYYYSSYQTKFVFIFLKSFRANSVRQTLKLLLGLAKLNVYMPDGMKV